MAETKEPSIFCARLGPPQTSALPPEAPPFRSHLQGQLCQWIAWPVKRLVPRLPY